MKVGVWPEASGAGTPHPVQRRLQVTAPPQHGSREGKEQEQDGRKMEGKTRQEERRQEGRREGGRDVRQYTGDEEDRERRRHRVKKDDNVRIKSWREKRRSCQTEQ